MNTIIILLLLADMSEKLLILSRGMIIILAFLMVVYHFLKFDQQNDGFAKTPKSLIIALLVSLGVFILIPSQKTIYIIAGAMVTNELIQTETADKAIKLLNQKLDEALGEKL